MNMKKIKMAVLWSLLFVGLTLYNTYLYRNNSNSAESVLELSSILAFQTGYNNIMLHFTVFPYIVTIILSRELLDKNNEIIIRYGRDEYVARHYLAAIKNSVYFSIVFSGVLYFGAYSHSSKRLWLEMKFYHPMMLNFIALIITYMLMTFIFITFYLKIYKVGIALCISAGIYTGFWFLLRFFRINYIYRNVSVLNRFYRGTLEVKAYGNNMVLQLLIIIVLFYIGRKIFKKKDIFL